MRLETEILLDYGDVPQRIGLFLLKQNDSSLREICSALVSDTPPGLTYQETCNGLAVLIQRKIVKFFIFEKIVRYRIDRNMVLRRLYFPIYLRWVSEAFTADHADYFLEVLLTGTYKETRTNPLLEDLLEAGVLAHDSLNKADTSRSTPERPSKVLKSGYSYVIVNFNTLDQRVFEHATCEYVRKRYNEAAGEVLGALLRSKVVSKESIFENLKSTKILIIDNDVVVNDKENITEYLQYLAHAGILTRGMDRETTYFFNFNPKVLKRHRISALLGSKECRRLFNLIFYKESISDTDLTFLSLLSVSKIKRALLLLQKYGLIIQVCIGDYRQTNRVDYKWEIDMVFLSKSMKLELENEICEKLKKFNECWDGNYYPEDKYDDGAVWISDLIRLSTDYLIFNL